MFNLKLCVIFIQIHTAFGYNDLTEVSEIPFPKNSVLDKFLPPGCKNPKFVAPPPNFNHYVDHIQMYTKWYDLWKKWNEYKNANKTEYGETPQIEMKNKTRDDHSPSSDGHYSQISDNSDSVHPNFFGKPNNSLMDIIKHAMNYGGLNIFVNPSYQISVNNGKCDGKHDGKYNVHPSDGNGDLCGKQYNAYCKGDNISNHKALENSKGKDCSSNDNDEDLYISSNEEIINNKDVHPVHVKQLPSIKKGTQLRESNETSDLKSNNNTEDTQVYEDSSTPCYSLCKNISSEIRILEKIISDIKYHLKMIDSNAENYENSTETEMDDELLDEAYQPTINKTDVELIIRSINIIIAKGKRMCNITSSNSDTDTNQIKALSPIDWEKIRSMEARLCTLHIKCPRNLTDNELFEKNDLFTRLEKLYDNIVVNQTYPLNKDEDIDNTEDTADLDIETTTISILIQDSKLKILKLLKESNSTGNFNGSTTESPDKILNITTNKLEHISILIQDSKLNILKLLKESNSTGNFYGSTTESPDKILNITTLTSNNGFLTTLPTTKSTTKENHTTTTMIPDHFSRSTVSQDVTTSSHATTTEVSTKAYKNQTTLSTHDDVTEPSRMNMNNIEPGTVDTDSKRACYEKCFDESNVYDKQEISRLFQLLGLGLLDMGHMLLNRDSNCRILPETTSNNTRLYNFPQKRP